MSGHSKWSDIRRQKGAEGSTPEERAAAARAALEREVATLHLERQSAFRTVAAIIRVKGRDGELRIPRQVFASISPDTQISSEVDTVNDELVLRVREAPEPADATDEAALDQSRPEDRA